MNMNLSAFVFFGAAANNHVTLPAASRTSANQEFQLSFVLSCDMASDMAMNRDLSNGKNECINYNLRVTIFKNVEKK